MRGSTISSSRIAPRKLVPRRADARRLVSSEVGKETGVLVAREKALVDDLVTIDVARVPVGLEVLVDPMLNDERREIAQIAGRTSDAPRPRNVARGRVERYVRATGELEQVR